MVSVLQQYIWPEDAPAVVDDFLHILAENGFKIVDAETGRDAYLDD